MYAMLQSADRGVAILSPHKKNLFNEHIKMNKDQSQRLDMFSDEIRKLSGTNSLQYKDSLSRLSEAIDLFKSNKTDKSQPDVNMINVD